KEADSFRPSFVMMNGVAGDRQNLWIELGSTNRASKRFDGSNQLRPFATPGDDFAKIIDSAPSSEDEQGNLLSWLAVLGSAQAAVDRHRRELDHGIPFGEILQGVSLAGFPRSSNTYLCNNVTYVTGWLMNHPNHDVRLLHANTPQPGALNDVLIALKSDLRTV